MARRLKTWLQKWLLSDRVWNRWAGHWAHKWLIRRIVPRQTFEICGLILGQHPYYGESKRFNPWAAFLSDDAVYQQTLERFSPPNIVKRREAVIRQEKDLPHGGLYPEWRLDEDDNTSPTVGPVDVCAEMKAAVDRYKARRTEWLSS